jgi:hypothetical protein
LVVAQHVFWFVWMWLHPDPKFEDIQSFDINSLLRNIRWGWLIVNKFTICLNILHFFHSIISFTLSFRLIYRVLFPPRNLPLFGLNELLQDPSTTFVVPSYVEAQTWAFTSLPSTHILQDSTFQRNIDGITSQFSCQIIVLKFELREVVHGVE